VWEREREREISNASSLLLYSMSVFLDYVPVYDLNVCISVVKCWGLRSPGILCSIDWWFVIYVSGQLTGNKIPVCAV